ncbi:Rieske (2Fe-2S) protein [Thiolinea disciformis]|uniref:Rieske (2Fe-2S) protein n=1 Tax=Thiolinea disciformis TaxID=125614 RepID=UPI00038251B9|nr:Rieske 2Fe-2S domain-containing protein [Thiolinea disciformis]
MWHSLIAWQALKQQGAYGFVLEYQDEALEGFVVAKEEQLYAYQNHCPHRDAPLNWKPHQFWDIKGEFLMCSMHGALFQPQNGLCMYGPCRGQSLQGLPIRLEAEQVQVWFDPTNA